VCNCEFLSSSENNNNNTTALGAISGERDICVFSHATLKP
jgi:hypothetical protein